MLARRLLSLTPLQPLALLANGLPALTRGLVVAPRMAESCTTAPDRPLPSNQLVEQLIPDHQIEEGLPAVQARLRTLWGTKYATRMRKAGRLPAILDSLPGKDTSLLLHLDQRDGASLVRKFGRNGVLARPVRLDILDDAGASIRSARVLPRLVHVNAATQFLENLVFLFCPATRVVKVPVPIKLWNTEIAPGVKKGGWLHQVNRTVTLQCEGWAIPSQLELDMRSMELNDIVRFADLGLPPGTTLAMPDPTQPVVRCATKVGGGD